MLSNFFFQIANLKNTPRTGWKAKLKISNSESVADHTYMMSVMAMVLSDMKNMDTERIIKMTVLHDWAESKIGDFMPDEITIEEKHELEEKAMSEILSELPDSLSQNYNTVWNDYITISSTESRFVHELDKLEMALQAKIYEKSVESENINSFITSAIDGIADPDLKKILSQIIQ
jgi:putative hydrolase of HD superfamily|tara:strand:- start:652 stop:1176 length:525 start_codon:yes stop_codon:yes gene_type:complete